MKSGAWIFLGAFCAFMLSWSAMVLCPQMQVGRLMEAKVIGSESLYPSGRPGLASEGLQVYRANGCARCHTEQALQSGYAANLVLTGVGTNTAEIVKTIVKAGVLPPGVQRDEVVTKLPRTLLHEDIISVATTMAEPLRKAGAKVDVEVVALGPDIARGWAKRRSVAEDYLRDDPAMPGSLRIGPDLSNVGLRLPDMNWHLRHLYNPKEVVPGSAMPPHRFLFQKRKIEQAASPEALVVKDGYEIVPKREAVALAAYLVSLKSVAPLFDAPYSPPPEAPTSTNAPATTNAPAAK